MKTKRRKNDFYPTLAWNTEQLLKHIVVKGTVLEACSGQHHITNVLRANGSFCLTNDIDTTFQAMTHIDAASPALYAGIKPDWVITNPPFNQAIEILQNAHAHVDNIALYLRISFLEPTQKRGEWLAKNPPNKIIYLPRTSHTDDGKTDSVTCSWMIWEKNSNKKDIIVVPRREKE